MSVSCIIQARQNHRKWLQVACISGKSHILCPVMNPPLGQGVSLLGSVFVTPLAYGNQCGPRAKSVAPWGPTTAQGQPFVPTVAHPMLFFHVDTGTGFLWKCGNHINNETIQWHPIAMLGDISVAQVGNIRD